MSVRVLIVDDHPLVRGGVVGQLAEAGEPPGVEQAGCLADALRVLSTTSRVDLVLLDLDLPDTVGTSGVETIRQRFPRVPVMVLSAAHDRATPKAPRRARRGQCRRPCPPSARVRPACATWG